MRTTGFIACLCLFLAQTPICAALGVALDAECDNTTKACDTTPPHLICDTKATSHVCKFDVGGDCTAGADKCATGLTCPANHVCAAAPGTDIATGQPCATGQTCVTGSVCDAGACKIKNGTDCTGKTDKCVDGATCIGTSPVCVCGPGRIPATADGKCKAAAPGTDIATGQPCATGQTCVTGSVCDAGACKIKNGIDCTGKTDKCVDGATCTGTSPVCVCGTGRIPATADGKCKDSGSVNEMASLLLIVAALLTSQLV